MKSEMGMPAISELQIFVTIIAIVIIVIILFAVVRRLLPL